MGNDVFYCPSFKDIEEVDPRDLVNGVPQKPIEQMQAIQASPPPIDDGIHQAVITKVTVKHIDDTADTNYGVCTIYFELEFLVNGAPVKELKVYNVTSERARNVLCAELAVLGHEVKDRTDFEAVKDQLLGKPVYVKVQTKAKAGKVEPDEAGTSRTYTFVTKKTATKYTQVNPRINW